MSEIKCRVWYEDEMIYSDNYATGEYDFSFDVDGILTFSVWNDELHELTVDGDKTYAGWDIYTTDIMQYIGLKDRDGKAIYEGDIVDIFKCNDLDYRMMVSFRNGAYGYIGDSNSFVSFVDNRYFEWENGASKQIKVVGNIHENKDLMTEE